MKSSRGFSVFLGATLSVLIAAVFVFPAMHQICIVGPGSPSASTMAELRSVKIASEAYYREYGVWPASLEDLTNNVRHLVFIEWSLVQPLDAWHHPYHYKSFDEKVGWGAVISWGKDGKVGGEGRNADIEVRFGNKWKTTNKELKAPEEPSP